MTLEGLLCFAESRGVRLEACLLYAPGLDPGAEFLAVIRASRPYVLCGKTQQAHRDFGAQSAPTAYEALEQLDAEEIYSEMLLAEWL